MSVSWADYNHDGFPDVYVSNDYTGPDKLYHNNGDNTFTDVIRDVVPRTPWFSMGSDVGDLNNDGLLDFFASDMSATNHYRDKVMMGNMEDTGWFLDFAEPRQYMRNAVYLNSGSGKMLEVAFQAGLASSDWTWTPRLEDYDNDGLVDVFATNGILRDSMNSDKSQLAAKAFKDGSRRWAEFWAKQPMHKEANLAFRNAGNLKFENVAADWGLDRTGVSFGAATADFDNDGDLDLVVNNADAKMSLFENRSSEGNSLRVGLRGTRSNRFGIGATVHVRTGSESRTRYVTLARGWLSASEPILHFGLGDNSTVDELVVEWPSGHTQTLRNIPSDQICTVTEPLGEPASHPVSQRPLSRFAATARFHEAPDFGSARHREKPFDDFAIQPLLPNRQSQMGPALAVADVDGDGDADCFLGGASGSPGQLLINDGKCFSPTLVPAFAVDAGSEDIDAMFFDIDGDGDQDLIVASGSAEWRPGATQYRDRLYRNNGAGQFSRDAAALPNLRDNSSCIATCDFDADGDIDVFVGGRAIPGSYPLPAKSHLLMNEGGKLVDATPPAFEQLGIVTDAIWEDIDGDKHVDLMVTTEWGPVRCLMNNAGQLSDQTERRRLGEHLGWWNSIDAADVDDDGDIDFLVTNFGHNTKYKATKENPELLYYGDLDGTGKPHIVEAKFDGARCLPRRGFSCSRNAMPSLSPKLKTFHNFASSTLTDIYAPGMLEQCQQFQVNTLATSLLINNGDDGFELRTLHELAQVAPSMCGIFVDTDLNGRQEIVIAQNFYAPQRETGRLNGGLSLLLDGDSHGGFTPVWARESGISIAADSRRVTATDVNGDGLPDLIFAVNNGNLTVLLNSKSRN